MADNVELNSGSGGATCATDDVGGVHFQKVKLDVGGDGLSVPVTGAMPISAAALPLPTGAVSESTLNALGVVESGAASSLSAINGKITAVNTGAVVVSSSALPTGAATSVLQGGGMPAALGAGGGLKVDGSGTALPVTGTITAVTAITNALPAGSGLIGDVALQPRATGGNTPYSRLSTNTTNAVSIVGAQTNLLGGWITNTNASPRYVKLYNKATAPDPASDTPVLRLLIPGNANGAGGVCAIPAGIQFSLGLAMLIVTGVGDTDATAVAANEVIVNLWYKS